MANKTVAAVVKLIDEFSNPSKAVSTAAKNMEKRITDVGNKFKAVGGVFESAGSALTKSITAPVMAIGGATAKMAMDFEDSIAKVSTIADSTEVPMKEMEQAILNLSNQTGIAAGDIANNVYDAISAGQKTGDAVNFVENATKLAKAGFADSSAALDILTTTLNAYGMEASEVGRVSDVLINTQNLGKTTVAELSSTMGKIIPTAKSNKVAFEQVAAGFAIMTSKGIATAETTTYMNSMLNELGKSGTTASKLLKSETGKTFSELMEEGKSLSDVLEIMSESAKTQGKSLSDMFGSAEAGKAAMTLLGDSADSFNSTLKKMENSTGATDNAFKKLQTNGERIAITINKVKNAGIKLGTTIMTMVSPYIEKIADGVSKATEYFSNLDEETQKNIVKFAGIAAAVGPVLMAFGKVTTGIGNTINNFGKLSGAIATLSGKTAILSGGSGFSGLASVMTGPVGIAIAAVVAGAILIYKNWDRIEPIIQKIGDRFVQFWETVKPQLEPFIELIGKAANYLADTFKPVIEEVMNFAGEFVVGTFDLIGVAIDGLLTGLEGIINFLSGVFTTDWNKVWENCKNFVGTAFSGLADMVKVPINAVISIVNGAIDAINSIEFTVPDWVPFGLGGKGWEGLGIPHIPTLATGTDNWKGGIVQISERGGEIVDLPSGSRVYPHDESVRMAREEGSKTISITLAKLADQIIVREDADIDRIADTIVKKLEQTASNMPSMA